MHWPSYSWSFCDRCRPRRVRRRWGQLCRKWPFFWYAWRQVDYQSTTWWKLVLGSRWRGSTSCRFWRWWCRDIIVRFIVWWRAGCCWWTTKWLKMYTEGQRSKGEDGGSPNHPWNSNSSDTLAHYIIMDQ